MGPSLEGLSNLVRVPVGCGEQNMVLFTPNIFVLEYLMAVGKLNQGTESKCLDNMKIGYQRELTYRRNDGSYSAFGQSDPSGSTWLTAFVVRSFGQARKFVTIDEKDLTASADWIVQQQMTNGCFKRVGKVYNDKLKGGLSQSPEDSLGPLTAYVLISLLESGVYSPNHTSVWSATRCLREEPPADPYAMALYAYAFALAKEPETADLYVKQLDGSATVEDDTKHWTKQGQSSSIAIETSGYYILTQIKLKGSEAVGSFYPAVTWLTSQRNSNGGFVTTQDTVVALQSLSQAAPFLSTPLDMGIGMEADDLVKGFKLNDENRLLVQSAVIPSLPTVVELQAVGQGCALVQFSQRYNVLNSSRSDVFELRVFSVQLKSVECSSTRIGICIRYTVENQLSNMAVLSFKLPSGYSPNEDTLNELLKNDTLLLKRYELEENHVQFYFDELSNKQRCFKFTVQRDFEVENIQPSTVKLYDYYKPEYFISKDYTMPPPCISTINQVTPEPLSGISNKTDEAAIHSNMTESPAFETFDTDTGTENDLKIAEILFERQKLDTDTAKDGDIDHLSNFVDVDHELDFSDGREDSFLVTALPDSPDVASLESENESNCPVCTNSIPANFMDIFCKSAFALRGSFEDEKVLFSEDASPRLPSIRPIDVQAEVKYDKRCNCTQITKAGSHLIIGSKTEDWENLLHLNNGIIIVTSDDNTFLAEAHEKCHKST